MRHVSELVWIRSKYAMLVEKRYILFFFFLICGYLAEVFFKGFRALHSRVRAFFRVEIHSDWQAMRPRTAGLAGCVLHARETCHVPIFLYIQTDCA